MVHHSHSLVTVIQIISDLCKWYIKCQYFITFLKNVIVQKRNLNMLTREKLGVFKYFSFALLGS